MTIVKRGSKFSVVSKSVKELVTAEWFRSHAKCIVDPSLVKGGAEQKYLPVIFNVAKRDDKEAQKLDFPSTTKQLELRDVKQPQFPSTPFTGEAYSQSFHNPRPSNTVKDGTHVIVQGDTPAAQGAGPFRGEHGPDVQFKGSDYVPDSVKKKARAANARKSIMIAGKRVIIKSTQGTDNANMREYPIDRDSNPSRGFGDDSEQQKRKDWVDSEKMKEKVKAYDDAKKNYAPGNGPYGLAMDAKTSYLGRSEESDLEKGVAKVLGTAIKQTVKDSLDKEKRTAEKKKIAALTNTVKKAFGKFFDSKSDMKVLTDKEIKAKQKADKEIEAPKKVDREIRVVKKAKGGIMKLILQYTQNQPLAAGFRPLLAHLVKDDEDEEENLKGPKLAKKAMSTGDIAEKIAKFPSKGPSSTSRVRLMSRAAQEKTDNSSDDDSGPHPDFGPSGGYKGDTSKVGKSVIGGAFRNPDGGPRPEDSSYGKELLERARVRKEEEQKKLKGEKGEVKKGGLKDKWIKQQEAAGKDPSEVPKKQSSEETRSKDWKVVKEQHEKEGTSRFGKSRPNPIDGGIGDDLDYKDVDEKELDEGVKVEQEHVKNSDDDEDKKKVKAADIALDHLAEDDKYYTKLAEMERSGKEGDKAETKKKKLLKLGDAGKSFVFKRIK